jgi:hypothetical protein
MYCILRSVILTKGTLPNPTLKLYFYLNLTTCSFYSTINGAAIYFLHLSDIRSDTDQRKTSCPRSCVVEMRSDLLTLQSMIISQ